MPVVGLAALRGQAVRTSTASPETGYITVYNAESAPLAVALPSLALCNTGANFMVCKDTADETLNAVTFSCDGDDTFDDASTTVAIACPGEARTLQVISIDDVKYWKITGTSLNTPTNAGLATVDGRNVFLVPVEINTAGTTNPFDSALYIAPVWDGPTGETEGIYIQHRLEGDLANSVHDACAAESMLDHVTNVGYVNALEASVAVTGGANTIANVQGLTANFHTDGSPTGTVALMSLLRAQEIPALAAGFTITELRGLTIDAQTEGDTNYSVYAPDGDSVFGQIVPKNSATVGLTVRGADGQSVNLVEAKQYGGDVKFSINNSGFVTVAGGPMIIAGTGDPDGVYGAVVGSLFLRTDGGTDTTLYVKESGSGNTGWVAK